MSDELKTGTGCTIAIGTTAAATTAAQFAADSYTEVGEVEEIGEFGDQRNPVQFAALSDGRVRKARGTADAGDVPVIYAHKTADGGQDALKTAYDTVSQSLDEFNFRIQLNDSLGVSATTFYFRAKIMSRRVQSISNDGIVRAQSLLAINSPVVEVAAT
jgi:hypothetical protein